MRRILIFAVLLFLASNAAAQKSGQTETVWPDEPRGGEQITEITLERTACFGPCPIYKVTLKRDGTATYEGRRFVERMGTYKGTFYGFERLAQFIEAQGYFKLKDNYSRPVTDMSTTITSVVRAGRRKTISNYGEFGPIELWGMEKAIEGVLANTKWTKVSDKTEGTTRDRQDKER